MPSDFRPLLVHAGLTLGAVRRTVASRLATAEREPADMAARLLIEMATGFDHAALLRDSGNFIEPSAAERLEDLVLRRLRGEPLSRILGFREFRGLRLRVEPGVLDPREDSETVVQLALDLCGEAGSTPRIVDLGTGSGALLCAFLAACPAATGVAVDLSIVACRAARLNALATGVAGRASIVCGRWTDALRGPFDIIVSNPPYIERAVIAGLASEVRDHDPMLALDGGADGLDAYRAIIADVHRIAASGAILVFEIGAGQRADVETLLRAAGFAPVGTARDAGGHERAMAARIV